MRFTTIMILLIGIVISACSNDKTNSPTAENKKEYAVLTLAPETVTVHQNFPATIEGQQVIEIRPMIGGYIQEIYVNEGDRVKKGQLLFRIKNPIYEQQVITAKASINRAIAEVNSSKMEIEKVRPLV